MSMSKPILAQAIATGVSQAAATSQVDGFASGIIDEITINGIASTGSAAGSITGLVAATMANRIEIASGYPSVSAELLGICTGIVKHLHDDAILIYPAFPYINSGEITNLDGSVLAGYVKTESGYPNVSAELLGMCTGIVTHLMDNAECNGGTIV